MSFRFVATSFIALSLAAPVSFANTSKEQIHCPQLATIQQASDKIDAADEYNGAYVAYSTNVAFEEKSHPWYVGAANISAEDADEALVAGKKLVKGVSIRKNEIAIKQDEFSYCLYGKGDVIAVTGNIGKASGFMFKK